MKFTVHIKDDKAPFFLELIQQLEFAALIRMENDLSEDGSRLKEKQVSAKTSEELNNLKNEINNFFGV